MSGVGIAANVTTRYRYARPRFDPVERSDLGFGLVKTTNPDNSSVDAYYYQREGLVGRPSNCKNTFDENGNPDSLLRADLGIGVQSGQHPRRDGWCRRCSRLWEQESYNVYEQDEFGPTRKETCSSMTTPMATISYRRRKQHSSNGHADHDLYTEYGSRMTKPNGSLVSFGEKKQLDAGDHLLARSLRLHGEWTARINATATLGSAMAARRPMSRQPPGPTTAGET